MKVKEESEKVGLKLNIQKTKIMSSSPITSWQIDGETMETVTDFIFLGSKITADVDCIHQIKRHLLLGRKAVTNLDSILKSRDITLSTGSSTQSYCFSSSHVWMWELDHKENGAPKNWCFWTVVLKQTLNRVTWTAIDQTSQSWRKSVLNTHWKDWSWGWSSNIWATWYEELTHWKRSWCWERLKAREGDDRGLDGGMASSARWTWVWTGSESWWRWTGRPGVLQPMGLQRIGCEWETELKYTNHSDTSFLTYKIRFWLLKFECRGMLVKVLTTSSGNGALNCSIYRFLWCDYSLHSQFQDTNSELI